VDLIVEFVRGKKNFRNFINLAFFLEELLQRKVEVVTPESLSPYMKPIILKEVDYVLQ
jgi:predicted nucleotidyltransferase